MSDFPGTTYPSLTLFAEGNDSPGSTRTALSLFAEGTDSPGSTRSSLSVVGAVQPLYGVLMPGTATSFRYVMRAYKTTVPTGHIYWEVFDVPDPLGYEAPFPPYALTDIVIVAEFCD